MKDFLSKHPQQYAIDASDKVTFVIGTGQTCRFYFNLFRLPRDLNFSYGRVYGFIISDKHIVLLSML